MPPGRPHGRRHRINPEDGDNGDPHITVDGNLVQTLITTLQNFVQQQTQPIGNIQNNASTQSITNQVIEQFRRYTPPRFNGKSGPLVLEEWIMELERIFEHIECADNHKVSCAIFQFTEDAGHWWRSFKSGMTEEECRGLTWNRFKEIVMEKYFPRSYRNQKQTEFLALKQGGMSVTEYERKFIELSRFATRLIVDEGDKADYFLRGLRYEIRGILAVQEIISYGVAVRRAHEVEAGLAVDKVPFGNVNNNGKRKSEYENKEKNNLPNKRMEGHAGDPQRPQGFVQRPHGFVQRPQCPECNKYHSGKCLWNKGVCFKCQEPGHYANECTKEKVYEPRSGGNARLYAFTQEEAGGDSGTMSGPEQLEPHSPH